MRSLSQHIALVHKFLRLSASPRRFPPTSRKKQPTTCGGSESNTYLTIGHGLLGEVIVKDHRVLAVVAEVLSDGGTRVRRKELARKKKHLYVLNKGNEPKMRWGDGGG